MPTIIVQFCPILLMKMKKRQITTATTIGGSDLTTHKRQSKNPAA